MEVTKFVLSGRDKAKLYGDSASYRSQLSNRIHNTRRKLGIATKPRAKYISKAPVTADQIKSNHDYAYLLLLTSERAWANAMSMREIHSTEKNGITGPTRSHIISRLHKASVYANELHDLLKDQEKSGATGTDVLEARAYAASLTGAMVFEKQSWEACVRSYSEARIIYSALYTSSKIEIFKDIISDPIDPSIRYGAYQMRMPRTVAVPAIARKFFPSTSDELVSQVEKLDPDVLNELPSRSKSDSADTQATPKTITWRSRKVNLEDAAIATALSAVDSAAEKLRDILDNIPTSKSKERAAAYDDVLVSSQDAVDATKHAIDELAAEGVTQGDQRMQSLQITRTAVSYELVSWRIGRNRVLVGDLDGIKTDSISATSKKRKNAKPEKEDSTGRKLAHLREKAVLYDAILQSLDSIKELPGVAADTELLQELSARNNYFSALKCLTISRSHTLVSHHINALALLQRASQNLESAAGSLPLSQIKSSAPPNIQITPISILSLENYLRGLLNHHRALVSLSTPTEKSNMAEFRPLVERLNEYDKSLNLRNLVTYPSHLETIPVKPLFFDAAWNYIDYPGRENIPWKTEPKNANIIPTELQTTQIPQQQQKKGWFGFGR